MELSQPWFGMSRFHECAKPCEFRFLGHLLPHGAPRQLHHRGRSPFVRFGPLAGAQERQLRP
ncbi:hypothetical protein SNE510_62990 [Streptomyces sp. NE5-10]|nr:hypothetical protein SNE510_62990 [Streptomyces sp. NE5-10]